MSHESDMLLKEYTDLFWELNDYSKPIGSIPNLKKKEATLLELKIKYESMIKEE